MPCWHKAVGGGGIVTRTGGSGYAALTASYPSSDTEWSASGVRAGSTSTTWTIEAYVVCASAA